MKLKFLEIETSVQSKRNQDFSALKRRCCRTAPVLEFEDGCTEEKEQDALTQFLQKQNNQLIVMQDHLEKYCNVLPFFDFRSAKYDNNLIKSYLLPLLVIEQGIGPTKIKEDNQFVSFKFGDVKLLDFNELSRKNYEP